MPGASSPVDLRTGPGGDLFYADRDGGSVRRISYSTGNLPPTAVIQAGPLSGSSPLTVNFNGSASTDPEGGTLTYAWDLDGDGDFDDSTAAQLSFTYTTAGARTVRLKVTDPQGLSSVAAVVVVVNDTAPTPTITTPASSLQWSSGQVISFSGTASDAEDGVLPASALTWSLILNHCPSTCHVHALQDFIGVASGSFVAPDHGYPSSLELQLTATDSGGLAATTSITLQPRTSTLTFQSNPTGAQLVVGGVTVTTPYVQTIIAGSSLVVNAVSPQTVGGTLYQFGSWSDGGAQSHTVATSTSQTYTLTLTAVDVTAPVRSNGLPTGTLPAGSAQTTLSLTTNENATCRYATTAGVAYASMTNTFSTTGGTAHSTSVTGLANGGSYSFFVRCQDAAANANTNDFTISFSVAQPAGLLAAYSFNEGTGTTSADRSGNNHPATLVGGVTWTAASVAGNAVQLNGTTGYISIATPGLSGADFTASSWVFLTRNTEFQTLVEALDPASLGWELDLDVGGRIALWTNGLPRFTTAAAVPLNAWTYVTLRRTGATWEVFVNAVKLPETGTDSTVFNFGNCPVYIGVDADIGCTGALNGFLQGRIDDVRVYNRSLTQSEIQADMTTRVVP
jgi:PKD repeat protein